MKDKINLKCVGLIACSDFDIEKNCERLIKIKDILQEEFKIRVKEAKSLFFKKRDKVMDLNNFFNDREVEIIFDISGGDSANSILDSVNYKIVKECKTVYAGYSDNTVIINSLYHKTGKYSYYYNINNLVKDDSLNQKEYFKKVFIEKDINNIFSYKFLKQDKIKGVVIGGNIRCFLKLAGTRYFPNYNNKILFLESFSGNEKRIFSYLYQLKHIGVFDKIAGLIIGVFTELENSNIKIEEITLDFFKNYKFPIIKTEDLGHHKNAKAIIIGRSICLEQ